MSETNRRPLKSRGTAWAAALNDAGYWAYMFDASWRWVFATDDVRVTLRDTGEVTIVPRFLLFQRVGLA